MRQYLLGICYVFVLGTSFNSAIGAQESVIDSDGNSIRPVVKKDDRLIIIGDSITQQKIYSVDIETYLTACTPQYNVWIMQLGWGGETAERFYNRMDRDLFPFKPTVVITCYGMNDGGYRAYSQGIGRKYQHWMSKIVKRIVDSGAVVVVGSPGAVDSYYYKIAVKPDVYNNNLAELAKIARSIAKNNHQSFVDIHATMMGVMSKAKSALGKEYPITTKDGVHPRPNGHLVMAYAFLKAMGLDGKLATITVDMQGGTEASEGHRILMAKKGEIKMESSRYPFCFSKGNGKNPGTRSILPYLPFNEKLNRFVLVVKNLPTERAEITWGKATKAFSRRNLESGINLAAEFLDNPFNDAYKKVRQMVQKKQAFETSMIREYFANSAIKELCLDDTKAANLVEALKTKLMLKQSTLREEVQKTLTPVIHTIKIRSIENK